MRQFKKSRPFKKFIPIRHLKFYCRLEGEDTNSLILGFIGSGCLLKACFRFLED